jgi:hypothetical protein
LAGLRFWLQAVEQFRWVLHSKLDAQIRHDHNCVQPKKRLPPTTAIKGARLAIKRRFFWQRLETKTR